MPPSQPSDALLDININAPPIEPIWPQKETKVRELLIARKCNCGDWPWSGDYGDYGSAIVHGVRVSRRFHP